jgi:hypothetical protein
LETKHFRQVLILVASMVTTAPEFISEPVAGKVKTVRNNFRQISKSTFSLKYQLHLLRNGFHYRICTPSITLPPPTARMKVMFLV